MLMIFEIITDILFAPLRLSKIVSEKKLKKSLEFMQYPYLLIGILLVGFVLVFWTISQFLKIIFR